ESAKWGDFRGVYTGAGLRGISHIDVLDFFRKPFTDVKGEGVSDIVDFYTGLVKELSEMGY
ncbi:MAG: triacylglycerol lipase, partial [Clostridia bacterium]|nr:triacylglycerol lipase [Clostridia bacterium]